MRKKTIQLLVIAMIAGAALVVTAPAPAFTNACGTGGHTGNTTTEEARAWWDSVNDPDCWVRAYAKCDVSPSGNGDWYGGWAAHIGYTSIYDCDWNDEANELVNWGYGWGPQ